MWHRRTWIRTVAVVLCGLAAATAQAADRPYDEHADAPAQVQAALKVAAATQRPVLLVFGANWCPDCRVLDGTLKGAALAPIVQRDYAQVVKVDVGRYDRNMELAARYGVPLKKGIPAVVVLTPQGTVSYATQAGELADARGMGEEAIKAFFERLAKAESRK